MLFSLIFFSDLIGKKILLVLCTCYLFVYVFAYDFINSFLFKLFCFI